jgi:hypothetical protein
VKILLGQLRPDQAEHLQMDPETGKCDLQTANNVYPLAQGYRPVKAFQAISDALPEAFMGGVTLVGSDGTVQLLAGTATDLYRFNGSLEWDSVIGSLTAGRWFFTKYGDFGIGTYGGAPVAIDLLAGTAAALGGTPPDAEGCMTVRDFLVLLKCDGLNNVLEWSGFRDREEWTDGTNQSGQQALLEGGEITGWAGGEYGLVFQRSRIVRMTYVGDDVIWQWDEISANVGCVTPGAVAQMGRLVFFLSHRGFQVTDGNDVKAIGDERIDRTFLEQFSPDDLEEMYATVDPKAQIVTFVMPNQQFHYHVSQDKWTTGNQAVKAAFNGYTAGVNLDQLDAIYGDLDAMGTISLDDPRFKGGDPQQLFVNTDDEVGALTGDNLAASFDLPFIELIPIRSARVRSVRPISDAETGVTVQFNTRQKLGEAGGTSSYNTMRSSGDIPCRVSGRYIRPRITIEASVDWNYILGLEMHYKAAGARR